MIIHEHAKESIMKVLVVLRVEDREKNDSQCASERKED
jgi:hypothetical protein